LNQKNPSPEEKITFIKKALESAPYKAAKITVFQFIWSLQKNSGKISADRRQKKIIFQLN